MLRLFYLFSFILLLMTFYLAKASSKILLSPAGINLAPEHLYECLDWSFYNIVRVELIKYRK